MLSCYIIDDEFHSIKSLSKYIDDTPFIELVGYNENPVAALAQFQQMSRYPDIIFLDIEMPQLSGLEMSSLLKDKTAIVFTTAHPGFALEAFELEIRDYLLKPVSYQRFLKCVTKLQEQLSPKLNPVPEKTDAFFYIQSEGKGKLLKVFTNEIVFIESKKNYVSISTVQGNSLTYLTLTEIEEKLPPFFLRISKSHIINSHKITSVQGNEVRMQNNAQGFLVGPSYKAAFQAYMDTHLIRSKRL
ncbi:response regulator transcription factor [Flaviaesturariibacter flavus]|uniref:Response regulator transcription factor n=1 Tax=Flaviaesturariibacter flavus TaxID=2502780 RepID=A0A4R1BR03_9BACT|nr:LytTR family DNA-binding domain-containing protein [Flaviaesturariibacter flavus]TCJ19605.1 response regulator transcription factor [Flaviaesturariibacter flavus]